MEYGVKGLAYRLDSPHSLSFEYGHQLRPDQFHTLLPYPVLRCTHAKVRTIRPSARGTF